MMGKRRTQMHPMTCAHINIHNVFPRVRGATRLMLTALNGCISACHWLDLAIPSRFAWQLMSSDPLFVFRDELAPDPSSYRFAAKCRPDKTPS